MDDDLPTTSTTRDCAADSTALRQPAQFSPSTGETEQLESDLPAFLDPQGEDSSQVADCAAKATDSGGNDNMQVLLSAASGVARSPTPDIECTYG